LRAKALHADPIINDSRASVSQELSGMGEFRHPLCRLPGAGPEDVAEKSSPGPDFVFEWRMPLQVTHIQIAGVTP
jgi:hypothetical protein